MFFLTCHYLNVFFHVWYVIPVSSLSIISFLGLANSLFSDLSHLGWGQEGSLCKVPYILTLGDFIPVEACREAVTFHLLSIVCYLICALLNFTWDVFHIFCMDLCLLSYPFSNIFLLTFSARVTPKPLLYVKLLTATPQTDESCLIHKPISGQYVKWQRLQ